jgi:hypothetical protein
MASAIPAIWRCPAGHVWATYEADLVPGDELCYCDQPRQRVTDEATLWAIAESEEMDDAQRHMALHAAVMATLMRCDPSRAAQCARIHARGGLYYD